MAKQDSVITKMLERFKLSADAEATNRKNGLEALKFRTGGQEQWDRKMLTTRAADNRPSESYNQIPQFVHQVTNDMRQNMPQVRFVPGKEGTKEVAEVYEDLTRNICSSSEAEIAFDTAADTQVTIGWGYVRVLTDYEDDTSFNQIIKIGWVPNPFTVYDDPHSTMQDRSDRKFLFVSTDMPVDDFNEENDKSYGNVELSSIGDNTPGWATDNTIRVVEYFTVEDKKTKLYRRKVTDVDFGGEDDQGNDNAVLDKLPEGANEKDYESRDVIIPKVKWRKCTATEVLEERDWAGKYIPMVFVSGEELNVDGRKELSGIVRYMMAPQRQYNYWTNAATEMVALAPKAPYLMALGQVEGLEKYWDLANVKNFPYLPYQPISVNGTVVGAPQRQQAEAPIQAMMAMVQQAQQNMYTTSGIYPASLGKQGNEVSGKAIMARQKEGDVSTFHFTDNMARAWRFLGRILQDLYPKIYDTGRDVTLTKEDKSSRTARINDPEFVDDNGEKKHFDFTVGTYDIAVTTGPSYTTKRAESQDFLTQLAQAYPPLMQVAGDLVVGASDAAGAEKIAERLKKTLPPGLADEPKPGDIPPQVQQQMQQAQEAIQQLQAALQEQGQELQTAQQQLANKQADIQVKEADLQLKAQDMQFSAQSEQAKAQNDALKLQIEAAKLQLAQEELTLKSKELDMNHAQAQMQFYQGQMANTESQVSLDPNNEGQLSTELSFIQQMKAQKAQEEKARLEAEEADRQYKAQQSEMLLQGIMGIQGMLSSLTNSVTAPKQVVRDPTTGLIQGVVTQGAS